MPEYTVSYTSRSADGTIVEGNWSCPAYNRVQAYGQFIRYWCGMARADADLHIVSIILAPPVCAE